MPVTVPCQVKPNYLSLTPSKLIISKYRTGKTLGSGTYAIVKEAIHVETGNYFACKVINKKLMEGREHMVFPFLFFLPSIHLTFNQVRNEIAVLKRISSGHRNIVTLHDYFEVCLLIQTDQRNMPIFQTLDISQSLPLFRPLHGRRAVRPHLRKRQLL